MKIKRIISMLLACLTLMAVAIPAMAETGDTLYIHSANGNIVNVRSGPGTSYSQRLWLVNTVLVQKFSL